MATSNNVVGGGGAKDERRRRIAERGSDRMALITGRIQTLPPPPPSLTSSPTYRNNARHAQSLSTAAVFDHHSDMDYGNIPPRSSRPQSFSAPVFSPGYQDHQTGRGEDKQEASNFASRLRHQSGFKYSTLDNLEIEYEEEPLIQESDNISEFQHEMYEDDIFKTKPYSIVQEETSLDDTKQPKKQIRNENNNNKPTFFSSRELNSCIIATETIRALSSLTIAVLVVFFYLVSDRILFSKPVYLLMLTDITIVIGRLYQDKGKPLEETVGDEDQGDRQNWGDAVKLLERGLVAYQALRGFFIDFSIYVVVVVCGTSLM